MGGRPECWAPLRLSAFSRYAPWGVWATCKDQLMNYLLVNGPRPRDLGRSKLLPATREDLPEALLWTFDETSLAKPAISSASGYGYDVLVLAALAVHGQACSERGGLSVAPRMPSNLRLLVSLTIYHNMTNNSVLLPSLCRW